MKPTSYNMWDLESTVTLFEMLYPYWTLDMTKTLLHACSLKKKKKT